MLLACRWIDDATILPDGKARGHFTMSKVVTYKVTAVAWVATGHHVRTESLRTGGPRGRIVKNVRNREVCSGTDLLRM